MKNNARPAHITTLVLAFGTLGIIISPVYADVAGTHQQLGALAGHEQFAPAISGTGAVWTDFDGTNQFDIYYQDVSVAGGTPTNLTADLPGDQFLEDIDRGTVVFTNAKPAAPSSDILTINASTKVVTNIASGGTTLNFAHPAIGANWIVFERVTTQYDIDLADRVSGTSPGFQVTFDAAAQRSPRVSGNVVVYEDYNADPNVASVAACIIGTSACNTFTVAAVGRQPDIDGDHVVFVGTDGSGGDQIFLYNLKAATMQQITTATSGKATARVSGNRIIWSDNRRGDYDVWSFDLSTGVEDILAGGARDQKAGDISDNRAVYDSSDGTTWLFTYAATPSEQIDNLIARVKSFGLPKGTANSLIVKLKDAAAAINANDVAGACSALTDFINETQFQSGKKLTVTQANDLLGKAEQIEETLGCP